MQRAPNFATFQGLFQKCNNILTPFSEKNFIDLKRLPFCERHEGVEKLSRLF